LTFVKLDSADVVRHKIVADIVQAYERRDAEAEAQREAKRADH
jgi:phosphate starvation-inducible protein PhoH